MMIRVLAIPLLVLVVAATACSQDEENRSARIASLNSSIDDFDAELTQVEADVRALSGDWQDVAVAYSRVAQRYREARARYEAASHEASRAGSAWRGAVEDWRHAEASWRFYQAVLKVALAMDRARMAQRAAGGSYSCEPVSTAAFRRMLEAKGVSLSGKDVDHIVPRALGGADHPLNYQVLDSSVNRSLGATWNVEKCAMAGRERCAKAVAISSKCGTYRGGF